MKHPRDYFDPDSDYNLRQRKRLMDATPPLKICALPHVMKRIDLFAMSFEAAAVEAAARNDCSTVVQIDIHKDRDYVGCNATDIAAAHGHVEIIKTIYRL